MTSIINQTGPNFHWPGELHDVTSTTAAPVKTRIIYLKWVTDILKSSTTTSPKPDLNLNETMSSNSTIIEEATNSTIIDEMMNSNSTILNDNTNGTSITEMVSSNRTIMEIAGNNNNNDMATNATAVVTESITSAIDTITTTTEGVFKTVSETFNSITTTEEYSSTDSHHGDNIEDKTLYIILGVVLGVLILVSIILFFIYKKCRSRRIFNSGNYCVAGMKEYSVSSSHE